MPDKWTIEDDEDGATIEIGVGGDSLFIQIDPGGNWDVAGIELSRLKARQLLEAIQAACVTLDATLEA